MRGFTCSRALISSNYPLIISDERCGGMIEFRVICFQTDNRKIHGQNFKRYPVPKFGAYGKLFHLGFKISSLQGLVLLLRIQEPLPTIGLRVPIPSEKNRNVGVINPFLLGHTNGFLGYDSPNN